MIISKWQKAKSIEEEQRKTDRTKFEAVVRRPFVILHRQKCTRELRSIILRTRLTFLVSTNYLRWAKFDRRRVRLLAQKIINTEYIYMKDLPVQKLSVMPTKFVLSYSVLVLELVTYVT